MDNLLGQISCKLAGKAKPTTLHVDTKQAGFGIPSSRSRTGTPSPRDYSGGAGGDDDDGQLQVCDREDSETYAKRTISEIETCLGFSFHGAAEQEPADAAINDDELDHLGSQVEAALQSGLNFKDRFTTSRKHLLVLAAEQPEAADEWQQDHSSGGDAGDSEQGRPLQHGQHQNGQQQPQQPQLPAPPPQQQQQQQHPPQQAAAKAPVRPGPPALGGLKLAVGSQMETGEWKTNGVWVKKERGDSICPSNLQVIAAEDLVKVKELGRGCFGSVWLARWRGVEVALKELLNPAATDTNAAEVFGEAEKLASLRHPCVMGFYGIVTSPGSCGTVAEYVCHGSLRSGLAKIKKKGISDKRLRAYIAMQAAYGMEYLHLHHMVHFDMKCDNLLCDLRDLNKPVVKIGDLGLSKTKKGSFISGNMRGTLPWMAPELFPSVPGAVSGMQQHKEVEDRVTEKVDIFSFGVVLWEIWTLGEQPYPNLSLQEIFAGVMTGTLRPSIPPGCDPAWAALMQDCWHASPRQRPSFTDVIARLDGMLQRWTAQAAAAGGAAPASSAPPHNAAAMLRGAA